VSCNTVRLCLGERNVGQFGLKNVVCVFDPPEHARAAYKGTPLTPGEIYLYLGEISNMPGHGTFATSKGQVLWGLPHRELLGGARGRANHSRLRSARLRNPRY
jgi:hypothetical protein